MVATNGTIDYRGERFVARFAYDAATVAQIKTLKQRSWQKATKEWVIERHRPSVAGLVRIGRERGWHFTLEARRALEQLQDEANAAEFSIDVVQGGGGEPWFFCMFGDDYELQQRAKDVPGAYLDDADDSWWIPGYRADSCAALLEIAQADDRLMISEAAWRLFEEPDEEHALPRGAKLPSADGERREPGDEAAEAGAVGGTWEPTELDYQMHSLSFATEEEEFKVASSLRGSLRPFQVAGVRYLCETQRAFLADELGLGKTVQALATIETLGSYPALVVCPSALKLNWVREAQRWLPAGRTISAVHGPFGSVPLVDVLIISYELLARHHQLLRERGFEAIVADESHYLKSRDSQRTQAAIDVAAAVPTLRLCLSANPAPSQPVELATQLQFLGLLDEEFGGFWPFASRYCAPKDDGDGMRFGASRADELAQRLRSTCYCRRERAAVIAQLPEQPRAVHWLALEERQSYARLEQQTRERLRALSAEESQDDASAPDHAARAEARRRARLECVQQVLHECGRQKTASISRWVANFLSSGEPLVVFAQHPDVISALTASFPRALAITGADSAEQRDQAIWAFQAGEAPLIICSLHAAGVGITLTRAAHVAFAEIGWSAAAHEQAEAGIHRIGQERATTAWYLLGDGTIDELVLEVIERKRVMAGQLNVSVLLEVAQQITRATEPRPSPQAPLRGPAPLSKIVG